MARAQSDLDVRRLSPVLGAEVLGIDVARPLDDSAFAAIRQAWLDHDGLLVIREQHLTPGEQVAFSRRFGPLFGEADQFQETVLHYLLPGEPAVFRVSNKVADGVAQGRPKAGNYWHSDVSFRAHPAQASLLYALEVPADGGDTMFANMYAAYAALPGTMKERLRELRAVHDFAVAAATSGTYTPDQLNARDFDGQNRCIHPVVISHPETSRPILFVNPGFTAAIEGLAAEESAELLQTLFDHAMRPEFIYRHHWSPGDLVIWDNRSLMHKAIVDYKGDRYLHRTTVIAERPA